MVYLHDSTFEGFLTCIYKHYYEKKATEIFEQKSYQIDLMKEHEVVETNSEQANKVLDALKTKLTPESRNHIKYVFVADDIHKDTYLLRYIVYGFKIKGKLDLVHTHEDVYPVHRLSKRVGFECHRFLGLIRFQDIAGALYCGFEPDNNIITLIAGHFVQRLRNERFIIHDKKRSQAIIYNGDEWWLTEFQLDQPLHIDEKEAYFSRLWKGYFDRVAIKERKNLKLQQQFVPKKYRANLTEFKLMGENDQ